MKKQLGFSLSEVLISLFLASIITTILMQFYLSTKHQYVEAQEILSRNLDLRWTADLISDSIRRAGFTPCLNIDRLFSSDQRKNGAIIHALIIKNKPEQSIQIHRMHERFAQVEKIHRRTQIRVSDKVVFNEKRPLLIADCEHAEVQKIFSIEYYEGSQLITLDTPLQFSYGTSVYIGEFVEEQWFIKEKKLHYRSIHTEELTPLIHSLSAHEHRVHGRQFIEINLGLAEEKVRKLKVAVRGL